MFRKLFPYNPAKLFREPIGSCLQVPWRQPTEQIGLVYSENTVTLTKEAYHKLVEENHALQHEVAQMEAVILSCQTAIRNGGFG